MSHPNINRNHGSELSMIKQAVQYAFFLVVCIWLLYQIHHSLYVRRDSDCDFIENNSLTGDHIARFLGRKGGLKVGISQYSSEEFDLTGEAIESKDVRNSEGYDVLVDDKSDQLEQEVEVAREMEGERGKFSMGGEAETVVSEKRSNDDGETGQESEVESEVMAREENLKMFKFSDENGVPEYESVPNYDRRSEFEIDQVRQGRVSNTGNQTEKTEACRYVCPQNATEEHSAKELLLSEK